MNNQQAQIYQQCMADADDLESALYLNDRPRTNGNGITRAFWAGAGRTTTYVIGPDQQAAFLAGQDWAAETNIEFIPRAAKTAAVTVTME